MLGTPRPEWIQSLAVFVPDWQKKDPFTGIATIFMYIMLFKMRSFISHVWMVIELCSPRMFWFLVFLFFFFESAAQTIHSWCIGVSLSPSPRGCLVIRLSVRHVTNFNIFKLDVTINVTYFPLRGNQTESVRPPFRSARWNSLLQTSVRAVYVGAKFTNSNLAALVSLGMF